MCAWAGGTFTRANGANEWVTDYNNGVGIEPARHDTQDNDLATGINQCLNKDGSNSMAGNLNLNNNIPTNIGAGTAAAPAICAGGDVNTGIFSPSADNWAVATNGTERVRIDNTGKVAIGTTTPTEYLSILAPASAIAGISLRANNVGAAGELFVGQSATSAFVYNRANDILAFGTNNAERMRIDNAGNVGINNTSNSSYKLLVKGASSTVSDWCVVFTNSSNATLGYIRNDGLFNTGLAAGSPYNNTTATAANVVVDVNGSLLRSTSSLKYKTDVQNTTHGLTEVLQLRPVTYKGKNDGDIIFGGLIAEEVHDAGLTEFVQYANDGTPDALYYGNMVSLAFKAIQELNAKVVALEAKVAALES